MLAGNLLAAAKLTDADVVLCRATTARSRTVKLKELVESGNFSWRKRDRATGATCSDRSGALEVNLILSVVKASATVIAHVKPIAWLQPRQRRRASEYRNRAGERKERCNEDARHRPNEMEISHGRVSLQSR